MSEKIQVYVIHPAFANFLKHHARGAWASFSVGELSREDAAQLWDEWKPLWLKHVEKRSAHKSEGSAK